VIKQEEQTIRLEQQIIKLTVPLAAVQPLISGLHNEIYELRRLLSLVLTAIFC
jgi:hypothetical protein